jgi:urea carboxylase
MEGPGGYQLVGRTVQVWNTHRSTRTFPAGTPWSLRFFDQIRFYPVSADELLDLRSRILHGAFDLRIEENSFNLSTYQGFLASIAREVDEFRSTQREAFREERERWRLDGLLDVSVPPEVSDINEATGSIADGCEAVNSPMTASVFQIAVEPGQRVGAGTKLLVLDAMKTEIVISSPTAGVVEEIRCAPGRLVHAGQTLVVLRIDKSEGV